MSALTVVPNESVTAHWAVPENVCPGKIPVAVKAVVAAAAVSMVMPVPPDCHDQAYVYGALPEPGDTLAIAACVRILLPVPVKVMDAGEIDTMGTEPRAKLTGTETVATCVVIVSVTVHVAVPETLEP